MDIEKMFESNNYSFKKIEIPFDFMNNTTYIINERKNFYVSQLTCDIDGNIEGIIDKMDQEIHDIEKNWDCFEFF